MSTRNYIIATLLLMLVVSNVLWAVSYRKLWYEAAQAEGMLDQAENYIHVVMPDSHVYQIHRTALGEAGIHCLNDGDATVRPVDEFGSIVVSCGK